MQIILSLPEAGFSYFDTGLTYACCLYPCNHRIYQYNPYTCNNTRDFGRKKHVRERNSDLMRPAVRVNSHVTSSLSMYLTCATFSTLKLALPTTCICATIVPVMTPYQLICTTFSILKLVSFIYATIVAIITRYMRDFSRNTPLEIWRNSDNKAGISGPHIFWKINQEFAISQYKLFALCNTPLNGEI